MLLSNNERQLTLQLLQQNLRLDGRGPIKERAVSVQFLSKRGHLLYHWGETSVLIKTYIELASPKDEKPSEGFIQFRVDCQICNGSYEQTKKLSVELSKLLEKNIVGSNCVDPESLCIVMGKYVWRLTLDIAVVNDDGNVMDAVLNGSVTALMDMRKPYVKINNHHGSHEKTSAGKSPENELSKEVIVQLKARCLIQIELDHSADKLQQLSIAHTPVSLTFFFIGNNIFVDATSLEEQVALTRLTLTMNVYKQICSIHKPGGMGLDQSTISGAIRILEQQVKPKTEAIRLNLKERKTDW